MSGESNWKCHCQGCDKARAHGREQALAPIRQQISDWRDMFEQDGEAQLRMSYVINQLEHAIKEK